MNLELHLYSGKPSGIKHEKIKNVYKSSKNTNVLVIAKVNGGKADSLNSGINYASNEIIITLDADSILERDALEGFCWVLLSSLNLWGIIGYFILKNL